MTKAKSWTVGIASLVIALILITSLLSTYKSFQVQLLIRSKEPSWEKYLISEGGLDIRGYLTIRMRIIQAEPFLSAPLVNQLVNISIVYGNGRGWRASGYTNSLGIVSFKLPPGEYEISTIYHKVITKVNITIRSSKSWVFADWQYFKKGTNNFQLILEEDKGTKQAKRVVKAIFPDMKIPMPLFAELYYSQEKNSLFNIIAAMHIINYTVVDNQTIAHMKLIKPLSLYEIGGISNLAFGVYWAKVEVFELTWR